METSSTSSLKAQAVGDLENELKLTRRVLEGVPDEHLGWKPHEKSWALAELAAHIANLPYWQTGILRSNELDLADVPPPSEAPSSQSELLDTFDQNTEASREAFEQTDDAALLQEWTLRHGERVLQKRSKAEVLRRIGISHMIHHRGQLTVYLRLLDVPVPSTYGRTADEEATLGDT